MKFFKILLFIYCTQHCQTSENEIVKSIMNDLGIKDCIIVGDNLKSISSSKNLKYFSKENIYTIFMDLQLFIDYIAAGNYVNVKTAIFMKTNAMIHIFNVYFSQVRNLSFFKN